MYTDFMSFFYFQRLYQKVSESKREVWEDPMAGIYHSGRKVAQAKLQSQTAFRKVSAAPPQVSESNHSIYETLP